MSLDRREKKENEENSRTDNTKPMLSLRDRNSQTVTVRRLQQRLRLHLRAREDVVDQTSAETQRRILAEMGRIVESQRHAELLERITKEPDEKKQDVFLQLLAMEICEEAVKNVKQTMISNNEINEEQDGRAWGDMRHKTPQNNPNRGPENPPNNNQTYPPPQQQNNQSYLPPQQNNQSYLPPQQQNNPPQQQNNQPYPPPQQQNNQSYLPPQ